MPKHIRYLLFWAATPLLAQTPVVIPNPCLQLSCFFATQSATVANSAATTLTIQQPATGFRQVNLIGAVVQCPGQTFTVDQSQNGTAATATAGTAVALQPIATINGGATPVTASAKIFTASNVGGGTAVAPTLTYSSGAIASIDLSMRTMATAGTAVNYSITLTNTGSGSCTGTVSLYFGERL